MKYKCGKKNRVVDALSRRLANEASPDVQGIITIEGGINAFSMVQANWWEGL